MYLYVFQLSEDVAVCLLSALHQSPECKLQYFWGCQFFSVQVVHLKIIKYINNCQLTISTQAAVLTSNELFCSLSQQKGCLIYKCSHLYVPILKLSLLNKENEGKQREGEGSGAPLPAGPLSGKDKVQGFLSASVFLRNCTENS